MPFFRGVCAEHIETIQADDLRAAWGYAHVEDVYKQRRLAKGLCRTCGEPRAPDSKNFCAAHRGNGKVDTVNPDTGRPRQNPAAQQVRAENGERIIDRCAAVLRRARKPMHYTEIASEIGTTEHSQIKSIASTLSTYARRGELVRLTPTAGTFELLDADTVVTTGPISREAPPPKPPRMQHDLKVWGSGYRCENCFEERLLKAEYSGVPCQ